MSKRLALAVLILLAFDVGLFLLLAPWTEFWEKNFLLTRVVWLRPLFLNAYLRGAVSGLGLLNFALGLREAMHFRETIRGLEMREAAKAARLSETV